jgi:3-oxoacyl-[acyl-carrier-protein] synthase-3
MELGIEEGRLKKGDLVLMISAGIGYAWDVLLLRWGTRIEKGE